MEFFFVDIENNVSKPYTMGPPAQSPAPSQSPHSPYPPNPTPPAQQAPTQQQQVMALFGMK